MQQNNAPSGLTIIYQIILYCIISLCIIWYCIILYYIHTSDEFPLAQGFIKHKFMKWTSERRSCFTVDLHSGIMGTKNACLSMQPFLYVISRNIFYHRIKIFEQSSHKMYRKGEMQRMIKNINRNDEKNHTCLHESVMIPSLKSL